MNVIRRERRSAFRFILRTTYYTSLAPEGRYVYRKTQSLYPKPQRGDRCTALFMDQQINLFLGKTVLQYSR